MRRRSCASPNIRDRQLHAGHRPHVTHRIRRTRSRKALGLISFLLLGAASTFWFLFRVIPKPSRATYPCMQAAAPVMSSFLAYLLGVTGTIVAVRRFRKHFRGARYAAASAFLAVGLLITVVTGSSDDRPVFANSKLLVAPNQPIGEARGIFPGRVVWVWDPASTNENIPLTAEGRQIFGEGWFLDRHTSMTVVQSMVDDAVLQLTGSATVPEAWDALFRSFNRRHGKGDVGYTDGERIFIRTNQVSASSGTYDAATYEIKNQSRYGMAETSPQVVLALLRQLVNGCGVKQEAISIGDPMKHMYKHMYDMWHNEFPSVTYVDADARLGRTKPDSSSQPSIYYSDCGTILKTSGTTGNPVYADYFPTVITEADYLIAIPALKAHARAGVTLCAKIHFGSNLRGSATHLHGGLVAPDKISTTGTLRPGYGLYRVQVDLMGSRYLGENTVLFLVDGLWGGSEANDPPRKFSMPPFCNDWTSSVFVSQDQVALESVCFDFLKAEFTSSNPYGSYPQIEGADDYILQAADSSYWPSDIRYDPENDSTVIGSLGVCEHWNNADDKLYTRNLGTDDGIELVLVNKTVVVPRTNAAGTAPDFVLFQNYPNPFNPVTRIRYGLGKEGFVSLKIFALDGQEIVTLVDAKQEKGEYSVTWDARSQSSGVYFCRLVAGEHSETKKLIVQR